MTDLLKVAFTGPREYDAEALDATLIMKLAELKAEATEQGKTLVTVSGGAQGFDEAAVHACNGLGIPVYVMFPNTTFPNYYWLGGDKTEPQPERLDAMMAAAKESGGGKLPEPCGSNIYVKDREGNRLHCNFARNYRMVFPSDIVVVGAPSKTHAKRSPGTAHALEYAESISKRVIFLTDSETPEPAWEATENPWG